MAKSAPADETDPQKLSPLVRSLVSKTAPMTQSLAQFVH